MGQCLGKEEPTSPSSNNHRVLFFPDPALPCRNHFDPAKTCTRKNCTFSHINTSLSELVDWLRKAKQTLDVCVFTITCDEISNVLMEIHSKGVKLRIITDDDQASSKGSDIEKFREKGMLVKTDHSPHHMHHKFAVIDGQILINGSFNWTRSAVLHNRENVVISEDPDLATTFKNEFQKLWNEF
eukprot:GCRY01001815.1.p1 GENE.GCRY01001815.1~~GCRY01001815.1.p1  ORF type:complete len:184 (+),score=9.04 GCRY01001815.1:98-649(+)